MKNAIVLVASLFVLIHSISPLYGETSEGDYLEMNEIVVTGTKTKHRLQDVPVDTLLIPRQEIENSNAQNISEIINNVPGFNFSQQASLTSAMGYKNTVRGLNVESRYLLVLVNGQRVFTGYRSGGMAGGGFAHNLNVVPVEMIDRIEIVKGPGSALYGSDAIVGVINIITKQPTDQPQRVAGIEYGSHEVKGKDYLGNEPEDTQRDTRKVFTAISQMINDSVGFSLSLSHEENDGIHPQKYDVSLNYVNGLLDFNITDSLKLRIGGELSVWKEKEDKSGDEKEETSNRIYSVLDFDYSPAHSLRLQGYSQKMKQDFKDPTYGDSKANMTYTDYEVQYTNRSFDNNQFVIGYEVLEEDFDSSTVEDKKIITRSWYLQDELSLFDKRFVVVPGVRVDDSDAYGSETNPKLSLMIKPVDDTILRLSAGRAFKTPRADQAFGLPFDHIYMWVYPNPDLEPETAESWQASIDQWFFDRKVMVSLTGYEMKIKDMIAQADRGDMIGGIPVYTWKNINEAEIRGTETLLGINLAAGLDLDLNHATTQTEDKETKEELNDTPKYTYGASLRYTDTDDQLGGYLSFAHTGRQKNLVYTASMSEETEPFTTVGFNIWLKFLQRGKFTCQVDNLLDEELKGSDTIYVGRKVTIKLSVDF